MSGDSPNSHANDIFDFKDSSRHSPTPTTSKDIGIQSSANFVTASVLVEPNREDKEKDPRLDLCSPISNQEYKSDDDISNADRTLKMEDSSKSDDRKRNPNKKINGSPDTLDGTWVPSGETKKNDDEEDDSCVVKCLYYTMQCCECAIM